MKTINKNESKYKISKETMICYPKIDGKEIIFRGKDTKHVSKANEKERRILKSLLSRIVHKKSLKATNTRKSLES